MQQQNSVDLPPLGRQRGRTRKALAERQIVVPHDNPPMAHVDLGIAPLQVIVVHHLRNREGARLSGSDGPVVFDGVRPGVVGREVQPRVEALLGSELERIVIGVASRVRIGDGTQVGHYRGVLPARRDVSGSGQRQVDVWAGDLFASQKSNWPRGESL